MARALELAARGLYTTDPNPRVGCVLVRGGGMLGEGWHERAGEAHAEVAALAAARGDVRGATAYVSLEPCSHTGRTPPCVDALIAAGIGAWYAPRSIPIRGSPATGIERLRGRGHSVSVGVLEDEARALNPGFFSRFERGRPYVRLKLAMSLDGRTAPAGGGGDVDQRRGFARRRAALARAQLRRAHRAGHGARSTIRASTCAGPMDPGCGSRCAWCSTRRSAARPTRRFSRVKARSCSHPSEAAAATRPGFAAHLPPVAGGARARGRRARLDLEAVLRAVGRHWR